MWVAMNPWINGGGQDGKLIRPALSLLELLNLNFPNYLTLKSATV